MHPYRDTAGRWTIYTGHLIAVHENFPAPWTQDQADTTLSTDMTMAAFYVLSSVLKTVSLTDNQYGALTSFTFNEGVGNLRQSSLLKYINQHPNPAACDPVAITAYFKMYNKDRDPKTGNLVVLPALTERRELEAELFLKS